MEPDSELDNLGISDLIETRLRLQIQNLKLERAGLEKKWYKKASWWSSILPGSAILIVGLLSFFVALVTGYLGDAKTLNEKNNVLLKIDGDSLRMQVAAFQSTKNDLIAKNTSLEANSAYLQQRIGKAEDIKRKYDSAIALQKGTIGQRNKFVAGLLQEISNLKDQNQQLTESISKSNSTAFGALSSGRVIGLPVSGINSGISSGPGWVTFGATSPSPSSLNNLGSSFHVDSTGHFPQGGAGIQTGTSLSSPLYIQDTSSAIFKMLNRNN